LADEPAKKATRHGADPRRGRSPEAAIEKVIIDAREEAFGFGETKEFRTPSAGDGLQAGVLVRRRAGRDRR